MAALKNISSAEERVMINEVFASDSQHLEEEEDEDEDVSLCDLPVKMIKQDQTQFYISKSDSLHVKIETQDQDFDFGSSMRRGSNFIADTKMCAADEVFFQGEILPLRLSVLSDAGFNGFARKCSSSGVGLRSSSCRSRISHNSSSFSRSSTSTISTTTTTERGIASSSNPRNPRRPRNQFYTEPSPKPQIKVPNARLEKMGSRNHKSSMWDFVRLGLVRTPDMELQDVNKVLRSNSRTNKSSVSRNSSVSSTNSTNFIANFNNAASVSNGLKSETTKESKQRKQRFLSSVHGCKCSFETVESDNVIIKSRSSGSGRSSTSHINESERAAEATHATVKEKVATELKMKKNNKQKQSKKQKQAMSHHRTYEWLKELSRAKFPSPVHV